MHSFIYLEKKDWFNSNQIICLFKVKIKFCIVSEFVKESTTFNNTELKMTGQPVVIT